MKSLYMLPAAPLDSILGPRGHEVAVHASCGAARLHPHRVAADKWNLLPCCLELVGPWVVPVDVDRACLRSEKSGGVVVAEFPDFSSGRVGALVHLQLAAIHIEGDDADLDGVA